MASAASARASGADHAPGRTAAGALHELPALPEWPVTEAQFRALTFETLLLCTHLGSQALGSEESELLTRMLRRELGPSGDALDQMLRHLNNSGLGESGSSLVEVPAANRPFLHYRFLLLTAGRPHHFERFVDFQQWVERQLVTFLCGLLCLTQTVQLSTWELPGFPLSKLELQRTLKRSFRECYRQYVIGATGLEDFRDKEYTSSLSKLNMLVHSVYNTLYENGLWPEALQYKLAYPYPLSVTVYRVLLLATFSEHGGGVGGGGVEVAEAAAPAVEGALVEARASGAVTASSDEANRMHLVSALWHCRSALRITPLQHSLCLLWASWSTLRRNPKDLAMAEAIHRRVPWAPGPADAPEEAHLFASVVSKLQGWLQARLSDSHEHLEASPPELVAAMLKAHLVLRVAASRTDRSSSEMEGEHGAAAARARSAAHGITHAGNGDTSRGGGGGGRAAGGPGGEHADLDSSGRQDVLTRLPSTGVGRSNRASHQGGLLASSTSPVPASAADVAEAAAAMTPQARPTTPVLDTPATPQPGGAPAVAAEGSAGETPGSPCSGTTLSAGASSVGGGKEGDAAAASGARPAPPERRDSRGYPRLASLNAAMGGALRGFLSPRIFQGGHAAAGESASSDRPAVAARTPARTHGEQGGGEGAGAGPRAAYSEPESSRAASGEGLAPRSLSICSVEDETNVAVVALGADGARLPPSLEAAAEQLLVASGAAYWKRVLSEMDTLDTPVPLARATAAAGTGGGAGGGGQSRSGKSDRGRRPAANAGHEHAAVSHHGNGPAGDEASSTAAPLQRDTSLEALGRAVRSAAGAAGAAAAAGESLSRDSGSESTAATGTVTKTPSSAHEDGDHGGAAAATHRDARAAGVHALARAARRALRAVRSEERLWGGPVALLCPRALSKARAAWRVRVRAFILPHLRALCEQDARTGVSVPSPGNTLVAAIVKSRGNLGEQEGGPMAVGERSTPAGDAEPSSTGAGSYARDRPLLLQSVAVGLWRTLEGLNAALAPGPGARSAGRGTGSAHHGSPASGAHARPGRAAEEVDDGDDAEEAIPANGLCAPLVEAWAEGVGARLEREVASALSTEAWQPLGESAAHAPCAEVLVAECTHALHGAQAIALGVPIGLGEDAHASALRAVQATAYHFLNEVLRTLTERALFRLEDARPAAWSLLPQCLAQSLQCIDASATQAAPAHLVTRCANLCVRVNSLHYVERQLAASLADLSLPLAPSSQPIGAGEEPPAGSTGRAGGAHGDAERMRLQRQAARRAARAAADAAEGAGPRQGSGGSAGDLVDESDWSGASDEETTLQVGDTAARTARASTPQRATASIMHILSDLGVARSRLCELTGRHIVLRELATHFRLERGADGSYGWRLVGALTHLESVLLCLIDLTPPASEGAVAIRRQLLAAILGATVHAMCCTLACHPAPLDVDRLDLLREDAQMLADFFVAEATDGTAQGLALPTVQRALAPFRCLQPMLPLSSADLVLHWTEYKTDADLAAALGIAHADHTQANHAKEADGGDGYDPRPWTAPLRVTLGAVLCARTDRDAMQWRSSNRSDAREAETRFVDPNPIAE